MSEFIVEARMGGRVWHRFRALCASLKKPPGTVLLELIEQFVRDERRKRLKGGA